MRSTSSHSAVTGTTSNSRALRATNVTVSLAGRQLVDHVNITAEPGRIHAILGPNGAGKSTLLRALCGLQSLSAGQVCLGDHIVHDLPSEQRAQLISWVPQHTLLQSPLLVHEVIAMGRYMHGGHGGHGVKKTTQRDHQQLKQQVLEQCRIDHLAQRVFTTLSGGERARVLIARALISEAPVMCLDEPTASLDIGHRLDCFQLCRDLANNGHTIIIVLHELADALRFSDDATLLHQGELIAQGTCQEVITKQHLSAVYQVSMRQEQGPAFDRLGKV